MENFSAFLSWLGRLSGQASLLVLMVLVFQRILGSRLTPSWRHALWWVVALRLAVPLTPQSTFSIFNYTKIERVEQKKLIPNFPGKSNASASRGRLEVPLHIGYDIEPSPQTSTAPSQTTAQNGSVPLEVNPPTPPPFFARSKIQALYACLFCVWLGGVILLATRMVMGNYQFSRRLND